MIRGADDLGRVARQHDVAAAITPYDVWLDALGGAVGRGIHMRTEANNRNLFFRIRRDGRIDVSRIPIACSSAASRRPKSFCFSVEGQVSDAGSDWVSITT